MLNRIIQVQKDEFYMILFIRRTYIKLISQQRV